MKKTHLFLAITAASLLLCGCLYRPTIQQGNVITPNMLSQLHPGLTQGQVRSIMGSPVLTTPLNPNQWDYVYTYQPGGKARQQQHVTLYFSGGVLQKIDNVPLATAPTI